MARKKLGGMMTIMETPLTQEGELDLEGLRRHTSHLIDGGVKAVIALGGNGEYFALTMEERMKVAEVVVDEANGRVPVVITTNHDALREVLKLSRHAQDIGAEGIMILPPHYGFYYELPDWAIYKHYETIANALDIQVMLYSQKYICNQIVPWEITADMATKLAEKFDNITCMKETYDLDKIRVLSKQFGDRFSVFCGNDPYLFYMMAAGARGATITLPCVAPKQTAEFFDAWERGDTTKAYEIFNTLQPLVDALYDIHPGVATLAKVAMKMLGIISSAKMRSVFWDVDVEKSKIDRIRNALENLGLLK